MHTRETLAQDLRRLGVEPGDIVFVHSSFKSLGKVDGGAGTVIAAMEDALGPEGLLLMPSFNLVEQELRVDSWDPATTPSTVGWLTEFFRCMPGTFRSDHYSHSVAARGKGAEPFVAGHRRREGLPAPWDREPWGRTYGTDSPMLKACDADGKLLMLGVDYHSSTYVHVVEVLYWAHRREHDPDAPYAWLDRAARLFSIRDYVDTLLAEVERHPGPCVK